MRRPLPLWSTICLLALFGLAGCDDDNESTTADANPFAGTKITVSIPAGLGLEHEWDLALSEWKQRTGAEVELQPRAIGGSESLLQAYGGSAESSDLMLFPLTGTAEFSEAEWLPVISEQLRKPSHLDWNDLFKGMRDTIGSSYGGPAVVPIDCPVLVCYYREDLLTAAHRTPPQTWEEYQSLIETAGDWAGGLPVVEPWGEEFRATMYLARAVSYVKHPDDYSTFFDIRTGAPQIDGQGFVRAWEDSLKAVRAMPPEVLTYDTYDCRREFFAGRAAMAVTFETGFGNPLPVLVPARPRESDTEATQPRSANVAAGFVRLPGSTQVFRYSKNEWVPGTEQGINYVTLAGFGGLTAAVSKASSELAAAAAWNLYEYLTSPEQLATTFPPAVRSICRTSQTSYPEMWLPDDITASEGGSYLGEVARCLETKALVAELSVVGRAEFRAALTDSITRQLADANADPGEMLQTAFTRWQEIAQKIGVEKVRDSYRRSLGLRPLSKPDN